MRLKRLEIIGFFLLLLIIDSFLYFRHAAHFFQADAVFLLDHRATSLRALLSQFTGLNAAGRYRPLTHALIASLFYPIFGLEPVPYRLPIYGLFFLDTLAVYVLTFEISGKRLAAALATLFFSIHTVNAYTTYDFSFAPELLYTLFYIGSVLAYLKYLRTGTRAGYRTSIACFVASLLSKEAAVTLPAVLLTLHIFAEPSSDSIAARLSRSVRSILPHLVILLLYVVFAVAYLNPFGIPVTRLLTPPENPSPNAYNLVFDKTILRNTDLAMTWAFNIPRGWWGQWRSLTPAAIAYLKGFRLLVVGLMMLLLLKPERKIILLGVAWFFITILPVLPLLDHLIPYYLFLPLAGLALVVGVAFDWLFGTLRRVQPGIAGAFVLTIFAGELYVTSPGIQEDIRQNRLLGGSAELALNSLTDMKRLYPALPTKANLYFVNADEPLLYWDQSWGGLLKMAYKTDELSVQYASLDDLFLPRPGDTPIVLGVRNKHLIDETDNYRIHPDQFLTYTESQTYKLDLSTTQVIAGKDSYSISVHGLHDTQIRIVYTLNDELPDAFSAQLDSNGRVKFSVSADTRKGVYRFIRFSAPGQKVWIRSSETITVQ